MKVKIMKKHNTVNVVLDVNTIIPKQGPTNAFIIT